MLIHVDMTQPVTVHSEALDWVPSPAKGVDRKMLYREGDEVARATSIVRYAVGSAFPPHSHSGGEEILVLGGTFQDEHGDYPAGCYFRNPPGTAHSPAAAEGCVIFVRLWQYRLGDGEQVVVMPGEGAEAPPRAPGCTARLLFEDGAERVTLERWQGAVTVDNPRGLELLVLSGTVTLEGETLRDGAWHRRPAGSPLTVQADQAEVWLKDAPLQHPDRLTIPES